MDVLLTATTWVPKAVGTTIRTASSGASMAWVSATDSASGLDRAK